MNIDHTEPTLFDVEFVGSDGCGYGSKWALARSSDVLHTIFTETKQDEDHIIFTVEEKEYTQEQLVSWLSIAHIKHGYYTYLINELDKKNMASIFVSSVLLCRKYNMPDLENKIFTWIISNRNDCYDEVGLQLIKNNVFDQLIPVWTNITLFKLSEDQLQEAPKDVLILFILENRKLRDHISERRDGKALQEAPKDVLILFILENRKLIPEHVKGPYVGAMHWWVALFAHGDTYIEPSYTAVDVERARVSLLGTSVYKRSNIGRTIWKQFSKEKKRNIIEPLFVEWKLINNVPRY
jgi:hypothetical protein